MNEKRKPAKGIVMNPETGKWDVYGPELLIRGKRREPIFSGDTLHEAVTYATEVEGWR